MTNSDFILSTVGALMGAGCVIWFTAGIIA